MTCNRKKGVDMAWLGELGLEDMLRDPIVKLLMRSDGVRPRQVRAAMARLGAKQRPGADGFSGSGVQPSG
jgi:hypothetical protein